jgi:hypothetical protein
VRRLLKFYGAMALLAVTCHVALSSLSAVVLSHSYDGRMPNVRKLDSDPRSKQAVIAGYLRRSADDKRPVTCFVGSSFTWGYPYGDRASLASAAGGAPGGGRTINASIIGAGLELTRDTLRTAQELDLHFARVVVEIPVVNELGCLELGCSWSSHCLPARPEPFVRASDYPRSYLEWILTEPEAWKQALELPDDDDDASEIRPVSLGKLPDDYFMDRERFAKVREAYGRSIALTLADAAQVADEVVAFPSPIYVVGAKLLGFDEEAIREQVAYTLEECRRAKGVVVVALEERHLTDPTFYANVTHFNPRGNREFGGWLAANFDAPDAKPSMAARADGGAKQR